MVSLSRYRYKKEAHDVAIMMALLKMARTKLGAVSKDTIC